MFSVQPGPGKRRLLIGGREFRYSSKTASSYDDDATLTAATCDSGPKSTWQAVEKLEKMLAEKGWVVRRFKEDGGCYEV